MSKGEESELIERIRTFFGVDVTVRNRARKIVDVKHSFAHAMRDMGYTYEYIGQLTNRDHATAMHSCKTSQMLSDTDREYSKLLNAMRTLVNDFHISYGLRSTKAYERDRVSLAKLYALLLRRSSPFLTEKEVLSWLEVAKMSEFQYKNLSRTSEEPVPGLQ
jgi:hypothetical protein